MNKTLGFQFQPEFCIQCHACSIACSTWHHLETGINRRHVISRFEGNFPNTKLITVSMSCLHCSNPACVDQCPTNALCIDEQGRVIVSSDRCTGCRLCLDCCPVRAPRFGPDGLIQKCDLCAETGDPACVRACPSQALQVVQMTKEEKDTSNKCLAELYYGK